MLSFSSLITSLVNVLESVTAIEVFRSLAVLVSIIIFKKFFKNRIVNLFKRIAEKTKGQFDDILVASLVRPISFFITTAGICISISMLNISKRMDQLLASTIFYDLFSITIAWTAWNLTSELPKLIKNYPKGLQGLISAFLRSVIIVITVIILLDSIGYNVNSLLATMGIGGIAIAYASQDTIKNLFGSFVILVDKPFKIGDRIDTQDMKGNILSIGIRSTKIQSLNGDITSIPNGSLANYPIYNWSEASYRTIRQTLQFTYKTTNDQIKAIRKAIREILENETRIIDSSINIYFEDFAESSLDLLIIYQVKGNDWSEAMEIRTNINQKIMDAIYAHQIEFAYPTLTLSQEKMPSQEPAQTP